MKTITNEYNDLKNLAATKSGWESIEMAWNTTIKMKKVDGNWYKIQASAGNLVEGFAIDSKTKKAFCGTTLDHSWAYDQLYKHLMEVEPTTDNDKIEDRMIKGWRGKILDFENPCIFIACSRFFWEPDFLKEIEESILEQELGLPLSRIFLEKIQR